MRCLISLGHVLGLSQVCIVDEPFPCTALGGDARCAANGLTSDGNGHCISPLLIVWTNTLSLATLCSSWKLIRGINDVAVPTVVQQTTPEPGSLMLLGAGVIGLCGMLRHGFKV